MASVHFLLPAALLSFLVPVCETQATDLQAICCLRVTAAGTEVCPGHLTWHSQVSQQDSVSAVQVSQVP